MASLPPLVVLDVSHISLVLIVLGAYVWSVLAIPHRHMPLHQLIYHPCCSCIGQLSYLIKEKAFMSSAMIALIVGIGKLLPAQLVSVEWIASATDFTSVLHSLRSHRCRMD